MLTKIKELKEKIMFKKERLDKASDKKDNHAKI